MKILCLAPACFLIFNLLTIFSPLYSATFFVTNTNGSGDGSLLKAIADANGNPGFDRILFNIPGNAPFVITPTNNLPDLIEPVEIDATIQPEFTNYNRPVVVLDGSLAGTNANGFVVSANDCSIKGFVIVNFKKNGIFINEASSNIIQWNFIGTDFSGEFLATNKESGILIYNSSFNLIGGTNELNLISGNQYGIAISGTNAIGNIICGNLIGTDIYGTNGLGNRQHGIVIWASSSNLIGAYQNNIISGNGGTGILIYGTGANYNKIIGNYIGTDKTGSQIVSNRLDGIYIAEGSYNQIGGANRGDGNIISGNGQNGITINNPLSERNIVVGNKIGTDITGIYKLGNKGNGIAIIGRSNIIGAASFPANLISGNTLNGIYISSTNSYGNIIQCNIIGLNLAGTASLNNGVSGVLIEDAPSNIILKNLISGHNLGNGIFIRGQNSSNNLVQINLIGVAITGTNAIPNGSGIGISNAPLNIIGGKQLGNVLSGNFYNGIYIQGQYAYGNKVLGNYIGLDISGQIAVPNIKDGVYINNAPSNIIGNANAGNIISGNNFTGIAIDGSAAYGNIIQGNNIGMTSDYSKILGNAIHCIEITGNSGNTLIGGTNIADGNIICGTRTAGYDGVRIRDGSTGNRVQRNSIFANAGLGIDLSVDGVSANDVGDADTGANNLQNFPVLTSAKGNYKIAISGSLNSLPFNTYTIDFYYNPTNDPSGYGEGQYWLGSTNVSTDQSGNVFFSVVFTNKVLTTGFLSATATDINGNTSEFCSNIVITADALIDSDGDKMPDEYELAFGLNPYSSADGLVDSDNDGIPNFKEYLDGTNPLNAADFFSLKILNIDFEKRLFTIQFTTVYGVNYNVSYANKIIGLWTLYLTNIIGFGREITLPLPMDQTNRFYKVTSTR
ncbi:MAG: beta strand repeat-containing protein [Verrucomicrobiia bacterium]